ncbi:MAG TPA: ribbon-helix-helix protein, CopG family [Thermoanaerobaculia bacterium]|nr:ribbon-helix-helix protein, CopG family [Thermoanaerobaculia bacterium]
MQTIQVVIDEDLLAAADAEASRAKVNRSALMREALRTYLRQIGIQEKERLDRLCYERQPDTEADLAGWEQVAAWPET